MLLVDALILAGCTNLGPDTLLLEPEALSADTEFWSYRVFELGWNELTTDFYSSSLTDYALPELTLFLKLLGLLSSDIVSFLPLTESLPNLGGSCSFSLCTFSFFIWLRMASLAILDFMILLLITAAFSLSALSSFSCFFRASSSKYSSWAFLLRAS